MTHRFGIVGNGRGKEIAPEVDTSGSNDLDVFIARDDIDIITVATPSGLHHEAVMKAAAAGKHWGGSGLRGSQGGVRRVPGNPGIGKAPPIDGREARKAVSTILAIYESARLGGVPMAPE